MMDEPFNGMDPEGIIWMRGFLRSLATQGRAVLVSSHLMSELQDMADHLVIVGRGKVIADTSTRELLAAASGDRVMLHTSSVPEATAVLARAGGIVAGDGTLTVSGLAAEKVVSLLGAETVPFSEVSAHHATLEQAYLELTRDAAEFRAADAGAGPPGPAGHGGTPASGPSAVSAQEVAR
jgi:ABC-2 type transport system ATP-binding protein